jgi:hypothetical protein
MTLRRVEQAQRFHRHGCQADKLAPEHGEFDREFTAFLPAGKIAGRRIHAD